MIRKRILIGLVVLLGGCVVGPDEEGGTYGDLDPNNPNINVSNCGVGVTGADWQPCTGTKGCMENDVGTIPVGEMRQIRMQLFNTCDETVVVTMGEADAPDGSVDLGGDGSPDPNAQGNKVPIPGRGAIDLNPNMVVMQTGPFTLHCNLFDAENPNIDHGFLRIKGTGTN